MPATKLLYLSRADVEAVGVTMPEIIDALAVAFHEHGLGHAEMPPKPGVHSQPDAFIHAMPAYIPALHAIGMKWVSGYPAQPGQGAALHQRPADPERRRDRPPAGGHGLHLDHGHAHRRGHRAGRRATWPGPSLPRWASSAAACRAAPTSRRSSALFPVKQVMAYDTKPESAVHYAQEMRERLGLDVTVVTDPREAVSGCDMVVTAGPILRQPHATIKAGWLEPGAFASLVDYDSYWDGAALQEVDKFCTDDVPAARVLPERSATSSRIPPIHASLGELVTGQKPGRESATRADDRLQPGPGAGRHGDRADRLPARGRARDGDLAGVVTARAANCTNSTNSTMLGGFPGFV